MRRSTTVTHYYPNRENRFTTSWRGLREQNQGHGRQECRDLKTAAAGLPFPHAARAIRITRRVRSISGTGKWRTCTAYAA
jgi:hypothetical protein